MKTIIIGILIFYSGIAFADSKYFAEVDKNNVVKRVIVADSAEWCKQVLGGTWIETEMNNPDKNYAGKGHEYWEIYKDFVGQMPFPSWVLNEKRRWKAPIAMPVDGKHYIWDENIVNWKEQI